MLKIAALTLAAGLALSSFAAPAFALDIPAPIDRRRRRSASRFRLRPWRACRLRRAAIAGPTAGAARWTPVGARRASIADTTAAFAGATAGETRFASRRAPPISPQTQRITTVFTFLRTLFLGLAIIGGANAALADPAPISAKAKWIEAQLDQMDVKDKWIAGTHIDWRTGVPDGQPESADRPPHPLQRLRRRRRGKIRRLPAAPAGAPAILAGERPERMAAHRGRGEGWQSLPDGAAAQNAANRGLLVVASYHNRNDDKPGHIAIVLPGMKNAALLASEGPDVMQAGTVNSARTSLRDGFSGHPGSFEGSLDRLLRPRGRRPLTVAAPATLDGAACGAVFARRERSGLRDRLGVAFGEDDVVADGVEKTRAVRLFARVVIVAKLKRLGFRARLIRRVGDELQDAARDGSRPPWGRARLSSRARRRAREPPHGPPGCSRRQNRRQNASAGASWAVRWPPRGASTNMSSTATTTQGSS